jgi:hypothetical protein
LESTISLHEPRVSSDRGEGDPAQVNEIARVDVYLRVGTATETVSVTADAITVDTATADDNRILQLALRMTW